MRRAATPLVARSREIIPKVVDFLYENERATIGTLISETGESDRRVVVAALLRINAQPETPERKTGPPITYWRLPRTTRKGK